MENANMNRFIAVIAVLLLSFAGTIRWSAGSSAHRAVAGRDRRPRAQL